MLVIYILTVVSLREVRDDVMLGTAGMVLWSLVIF
jgi:hypothetical protein